MLEIEDVGVWQIRQMRSATCTILEAMLNMKSVKRFFKELQQLQLKRKYQKLRVRDLGISRRMTDAVTDTRRLQWRYLSDVHVLLLCVRGLEMRLAIVNTGSQIARC